MTAPTIAELEIKIDSNPIVKGKEALNDFADAAERASKAGKDFNKDTTSGGGLAPATETTKVKDLSEAIDAQTRKLNTLAQQRQKLESSGMKSTMPQEYERLNRIIDANVGKVMMQGNAVDQLANKQKIQAEREENAANAKLRAQERIVAATVQQENIVSNAAAKQQRTIDATINGLSRQIKAQNEYNETIRKLNEARVIGSGSQGMMGGKGISGEEYDTYVKLAQAQRDASYAVEDNAAAMQRAQSKLETYYGTLGKVERAEVQYVRAMRTLNENLENNKITQEQYNAMQEQFAEKRDKVIASTESSAAAEAKLERQLKQVVGAYDPVLRAQQNYENSVRILKDGLDSGVISQDQFNKALGEQREALDKVKASQSSFGDVGAEYDRALQAVLPYRTELANLEMQQKRLDDAKKAGMVTTPQQIKDYDEATAAIKRQTAEYQKRIKEGQNAGITFKQEQAALRGLPAQFTDIVVSLQGGQAPLTVLLQQGGQIKDMFGGIGPAIKGMTSALIGMLNPATVVAAALGTIGIAAYSGSQEINNFNKALVQTNNVAGVTTNDFYEFQTQLENTGTTASKAAAALTLLEAGGKVGAESFTLVAEAAIKMEKATGASMAQTIEDFNAIGKDPVDAAVRLDEKYRFLTASVLTQAQALVTQGKEQEAVTLIQTKMAEAAITTADKVVENAGYIERAWKGVTGAITGAWEALKGIGRDDSSAQKIAKLQADQAAIVKNWYGGDEAAAANDRRYKANADNIKQLQAEIDTSKKAADEQSKNERTREQSVDAMNAARKRSVSALEGVAKAEHEYNEVVLENQKARSAGKLSAEAELILTNNLANAQKKLDEAKEKANKPKHGSVDTTNLQEVKSNLSVINAEYEGYYKRVTALGEANVVSAEATYNSQKAILEAQRKAVSASYDEQIGAINKLKDNKKNSTAQNISLDNQLTKAEAGKLKAMEEIDAKLDVLQTKENGRIQERTRNISAYKAALDAQLENLVVDGERNAEAVGRGRRQGDIAKQLGDNDRNFAKQQRQLANALSEGMDPEEYSAKLKDLERSHTDMSKQIIANDKAIQEANLDWTNGFTAAIEDAQDVGLDFASSMYSALSGAFQSAGDALGEFVTTGKLNFRDFATSIIADMARIASQQAASGLLSGLLGAGMSAASAYFGGASSLGSTSAGYSSKYMANFTPYQQAKGGAWEGGKQYFAKGGAFTNSVVSSPTEFGMANGTGIMGEAGPEAIMPLARTRDGSLGVRVDGLGGGGSGGPVTVVNVKVNVTEGQVNASSDGGATYDDFGNRIGTFVRQEVYTIINKETRPGGTLQPQS